MKKIIQRKKQVNAFDLKQFSFLVYKVLFFILFLCFFVPAFNFLFPYLAISLTILAIILFGFSIKNFRAWQHSDGFFILGLFWLSMLLTFFLREKTRLGIMDLLFAFNSIFFLYGSINLQNCKQTKKEFQHFSIAAILASFIPSLISIILLFSNYQYQSHCLVATSCRWLGILETRLYGAFLDPNYASLLATVILLFSIYWYQKSHLIWQKSFFSISILVHYLYIVFSYSRTGMLALIISLSLYFFLTSHSVSIFQSWPKKVRLVARIGFSLLIIIVLILLAQGMRRGFNVLYSTSIERNNYVMSEDISNHRFEIWQDGINMIQTKPWFGVGFRNIKPYMTEYFPNSYIGRTEDGYEFHNVFLSIFAGQGFLGGVLFIGFTIMILRKTISHLFEKKKKGLATNEIVLICSIFGLSIGAFFLTDLFYLPTPTSVLFWVLLGYWMTAIRKENVL